MRSVLVAIGLMIFVTACASRSDIESEETIHTCIFNAMDEAVQERSWVEWDSDANNCSLINPHRGKLLLKEAEIIQNRICAEFFTHFQMFMEEGWQDYIDNVITACRHPMKSEWFAYSGDNILDQLIIDEILK